MWESVIVLCFVVRYFMSILVCNHLDWEERERERERERGRELVALLNLSSWCFVIAVWLILEEPWVCLQFEIVIFPDHTHYYLRSS